MLEHFRYQPSYEADTRFPFETQPILPERVIKKSRRLAQPAHENLTSWMAEGITHDDASVETLSVQFRAKASGPLLSTDLPTGSQDTEKSRVLR